MSDAHEVISQAIIQNLPISQYDETMYLPKAVKAIIAALPGIVPPLVWVQWGSGEGETTIAPVTGYEYSTALSYTKKGLWRLRGPWLGHTYHETKEAAKAAAQAHRVARWMADGGLVLKGTRHE